MFGLGTLINGAAIVLGGLLGLFFGKLLPDRTQDGLGKVCGISTIFIGISGALEQMITVEGTGITAGGSLLVILCLALGALIGEGINIEGAFERFGGWLKIKSGSAKDTKFVEGFLTASFTVCIGAMAIVGALEDGLSGDISILTTKAILDFIIILVMAGSLGKGCIFSAIPVVVLQGAVTLLAKVVAPIMTDAALSNLSLVGNVLIFCVGVNLVFGPKVRVANLLPAIILAVAAAFLPWSL
ncbi:MAG: DUF554 domain-containing protein [Clostridiales bacterium]|nr:DUF554 domain-containing protein [Clostridiales bacterium]